MNQHEFLLFHCLVEIFSIVVAFGIFVIAWNSKQFLDNAYLLILGIAYLFVGGIDLLHTLTYKGMGVFADDGSNVATQLWIVARALESVSILIALCYRKKVVNSIKVYVLFACIFCLVIAAIFVWKFFPNCIDADGRLTTFKISVEYAICLVLLCSIGLMTLNSKYFDPPVFRLILASIIITMASEVTFTLYTSVYELSNVLGHLLKLISIYCMYRAIIVRGLRQPYSLLFQGLKRSEESLRREKERLEQALAQIKTLKGLLPICCHCKKIRDDEGYWNQIDSYIQKHSNAAFSHSICPDCARELYPDFISTDETESSSIIIE